MPYSGADDENLPSNVQELPKKDREQWVEVFNSAYASCIADGGSESECETSAFKQANGVVKEEVQSLFTDMFEKLRSLATRMGFTKERAISMPDVYNQVSSQLWEQEDWAWLVDVFMEESSLFAILAIEGKLYRANISVDTSTNTATLSERSTWFEVMQEFMPVSQSLRIHRQADNTYRWFLLAGTTVLNRNGSIDSSELFDSMIAKCESGEPYPYLTFFHIGEKMQMGMTDYLARDGVALIASGTFDDSKIALAMIQAYEADPEYWGSSICFWVNEYHMEEIAKDVKVPVYTDGSFVEISILPEESACALFTTLRSTKEVKRMSNPKVVEAVNKLAGGDEELANEFLSTVDEVNRKVEDEKLIHRDAEPTPEPEPDPAPATESVPVLELDEAAINKVAEAMTLTPAFVTMQETMAEMQKQLQSMTTDLSNMHGVVIKATKEVDAKLEQFKAEEQTEQRERFNDSSAHMLQKHRVTFRPTKPLTEEQATKPSFADIAAATTANIS
jgi:cation transport regulator ChaB